MPSATPLEINDGAATPVAHTFQPSYIGPDRQVFNDIDYGAATLVGRPQIITSFSPSNGSRNTTRVQVRVNLPVEQVVDGVTVVANTCRFTGEFIIPKEAVQATRDDLAAFAANALDAADVAGMVTDYDPIY